MPTRSVSLRLTDIVEAIARIRAVRGGMSLESFDADWEKRWLVERGIEILVEASRHLPDDVKARHPNIAWRKVAGIGNVLRHGYEQTAPDILWKFVQVDLALLEGVYRIELRK